MVCRYGCCTTVGVVAGLGSEGRLCRALRCRGCSRFAASATGDVCACVCMCIRGKVFHEPSLGAIHGVSSRYSLYTAWEGKPILARYIQTPIIEHRVRGSHRRGLVCCGAYTLLSLSGHFGQGGFRGGHCSSEVVVGMKQGNRLRLRCETPATIRGTPENGLGGTAIRGGSGVPTPTLPDSRAGAGFVLHDEHNDP